MTQRPNQAAAPHEQAERAKTKPLWVIVLPSLVGGGVERMRLRLAREWLARGQKLELVLMRREGTLLEQVPAEMPIVSLDADRVARWFTGLVAYLRRTRPEVVIAAMWPLTAVTALAAKLARPHTKVIVSEHAVIAPRYRGRGLARNALLRLGMAAGYRLADGRVSVSEDVRRDQAKLAHLDPERFSIIYNPAALEGKFTTNPLDSKPNLDRPRILSVGNLKPVKDHATLIRAFAASRIAQRGELWIIGEGALRAELLALARELGVGERVHLPGYCEDPSPHYAAASLFVLSSLHEGFGNVLVEALSFGLPIVSTNCEGGPHEILADGRFGRLVPVGDWRAMADAIDATLEAPHEPAAQHTRSLDFSVAASERRYHELIESLLLRA